MLSHFRCSAVPRPRAQGFRKGACSPETPSRDSRSRILAFLSESLEQQIGLCGPIRVSQTSGPATWASKGKPHVESLPFVSINLLNLLLFDTRSSACGQDRHLWRCWFSGSLARRLQSYPCFHCERDNVWRLQKGPSRCFGNMETSWTIAIETLITYCTSK